MAAPPKSDTFGINGGGAVCFEPIRRSKAGSTRTNNAGLQTGVKNWGHLVSERSEDDPEEMFTARPSAVLSTENTSHLDSFAPLQQVSFEKSRVQNQVCLKDLCPDDKRRIANLVEELARVSEEKEESVKRLKDEQGHFERKIHQLEEQNLLIAKERENMQQQYRECQELLGLYQQYLSQQQVKLNHSIAELNQTSAQNKVQRNEGSSRVADSHEPPIDGSYLGFTSTQAHQSVGGRRGNHFGSSRPSLSSDSEFSSNDKQHHQEESVGRKCQFSSRGRRSRHQHSGHCDGCEAQQRVPCSGCPLEDCHHEHANHCHCERVQCGSSIPLHSKEALTSPLLGHRSWEEKRHQLLIQKMQLEKEREKLQVRLAEQDERLNRQNQLLSQSRLNYKSFQEVNQSVLSAQPQVEHPSGIPAAEHDKDLLQDKPVLVSESSVKAKRDVATSPHPTPASQRAATSQSVNTRKWKQPPETSSSFSGGIPKVFPGHPRDFISPVCPSCREHVTREAYRSILTSFPNHLNWLHSVGFFRG